MTEREALKLVYENSTEHDWPEDIWNAIKEALAKPSVSVEQEPVAYWDDEETFVLPKQKEWDKRTGGISTFGCDTPLYTTPPQGIYYTPHERTWVGLSVFEINDLVENTEYEDYRDLVERTEAKLKEKNT